MQNEKRNVFLLAGAQALFQTSAVLMFTLAALAGQMLADDKRLATLPVALSVATTAVLLIPTSLFMQRFGRKTGFLIGTLFGIISGSLAAYALHRHDFWLFVFGIMCMGVYQSAAMYYRFAAADAASVDFKARAISWVVAGGVVAAVAGPAIARYTSDLGVTPFLYSYVALAVLGLPAAIVVSALKIQAPSTSAGGTTSASAPRPLSQIMRQPVFIGALTSSTVGFAVMAMIMTATPLAMQFCGLSVAAAADVIQWHVLGMFVPSFFTGHLIRRFGVRAVIATGICLLVIQVLIAISGIEFMDFVSSLILLGVGWNFLFIGGTNLLVQAYRPGEQAKTQAAHDFLMFVFTSVASFSAGGLLNAWGWNTVNLVALPLLALAAAAIYCLGRKSGKAA